MIKFIVKAVKLILSGIHKILGLIIKYVKMAVIIASVSVLVTYVFWKIWDHNMTEIMSKVPSAPPSEKILEIYQNISRVTEVTNRVPPIAMWASFFSFLEVNAFTTGQAIYFNYATDRLLNDDEKALIMGHEIAHVILHHTDNEFGVFVNSDSNENELMADNVGATWADKAGYDVCKGREVYKKFYLWGGNSLNASHPPNSIRYQNLEHYCKGAK